MAMIAITTNNSINVKPEGGEFLAVLGFRFVCEVVIAPGG
jgi:hypothetical protein